MRKLFYIIWIVALVYAVFAALGGNIFPFGELFIHSHDTGGIPSGGLYGMCKIERFRQTEQDIARCEEIPDSSAIHGYNYTLYDFSHKLDYRFYSNDSSDVLVFGDSFIGGMQGITLYCNDDLSDTITIHIASADGSYKGGENPLHYFERINYKKGRRRIAIVETVERSSIKRALDYPSTKLFESSVFSQAIAHIFGNEHVEYFFTDNEFSYGFFKALNNLKFEYFGDIDNRIGAYSVDPKMLFYSEAVDFNRSVKTDYTINRVADNIEYLADELYNRYNIVLIYTIIPNKYSIYNDYADSSYRYDDFIPHINNKLIDRGVSVIDVYSPYRKYHNNDDSMLLYYPSDTHYSPFGRQIFLKATIAKVIEINQSNQK